MRGYGKLVTTFWTIGKGRDLRGDPVALAVAPYLFACPHGNMIGVFHLPIAYVAADLGLSSEEASKGLRRVCEAGIAVYDEASDAIFVPGAAGMNLGETLKSTDKRRSGVLTLIRSLEKHPFIKDFVERYREQYGFTDDEIPKELRRGLEGASKGLRSQEQEQEQYQEQDPPKAPQGVGGGGVRVERVPVGEPPADHVELNLHELSDAMRTRFHRAWLDARQTSPAMGGRNLGGFVGSVAETAEAQGVDPLELFGAALRRFLGGELDEVALRAPYAVFASRWGQLTDPRGPGGSDARQRASRAREEAERARRDLRAQVESFGRSANG